MRPNQLGLLRVSSGLVSIQSGFNTLLSLSIATLDCKFYDKVPVSYLGTKHSAWHLVVAQWLFIHK